MNQIIKYICPICKKRVKKNASNYLPYCSYICFNVYFSMRSIEKVNNDLINRYMDDRILTDEEEFLEFLQRQEQRFNLTNKQMRQIKYTTFKDLTRIYIKREPTGKQMLRLERTRRSDEYYRSD